jgi:hypothetical protein
LEWQCDQIAERAFREEVLRREKPVIARQVELGTRGHRLTEQVKTNPPRFRCKNGLAEEYPHVRAISRPRALERNRNANGARDIVKSKRVEDPARTVEVTCKERAVVVPRQRVDAKLDLPGEMRSHDVISERKKFAVGFAEVL